MGRPATGRTKKITTVSVDIDLWTQFVELIEKKQPDGDTTPSSHVETLVRREVERLTGKDVPDVVDKAALERKLLVLSKRAEDLRASFRKRNDGTIEKLNDLCRAYQLDTDHYSNTADVISRALKDRDETGTLAHQTFSSLPPTDLNLFIATLEVSTEIEETNQKLTDASKQRYLTTE